MRYTRIAMRPDRPTGVTYLRGSNIRVDSVVSLRAHTSEEAILEAFPELEREDIRHALAFAAETVKKLPREVALKIIDGGGRTRRIRRRTSRS